MTVSTRWYGAGTGEWFITVYSAKSLMRPKITYVLLVPTLIQFGLFSLQTFSIPWLIRTGITSRSISISSHPSALAITSSFSWWPLAGSLSFGMIKKKELWNWRNLRVFYNNYLHFLHESLVDLEFQLFQDTGPQEPDWYQVVQWSNKRKRQK